MARGHAIFSGTPVTAGVGGKDSLFHVLEPKVGAVSDVARTSDSNMALKPPAAACACAGGSWPARLRIVTTC